MAESEKSGECVGVVVAVVVVIGWGDLEDGDPDGVAGCGAVGVGDG